MKRALLVAFHFPPVKISSGLERSLSLVRHLPAHGWQPLVLTASPNAYPNVSDERLQSIPEGTVVKRAFAVDSVRTLTVFGHFPSWAAVPDRWQSWVPSAVLSGLSMIRRYKPSVIWSTYPIVSAHFVAAWLHKLSNVPWVADFRDPMVEYDDRAHVWYPPSPLVRNLRLRAERAAVQRGSALTFCTAGSRDISVQRYPDARHDRWHVIPNGFDEGAFEGLQARPDAGSGGPITILHSGTIYPGPDRDPTCLLRALSRVVKSRALSARPLQVILRGSGVDDLYKDLVAELGLGQVIRFAPLVEYRSALQEMINVDGLLLFQGYTSNPAVPAKLYEYFRAGRPILALVDGAGDTARQLRQSGVGSIAPLDDIEAIAVALERFVSAIEDGTAAGIPQARAGHFERRHSVASMAGVFDSVGT